MTASPFLDPSDDGRGNGRHAGGEHQGAHDFVRGAFRRGPQQLQPFQHGDLLGGLVLVGVVQAGVGVAGYLASEHVRPAVYISQAEGGGLVDGDHMGVVGVAALADVGHECAEALLWVIGSHKKLLNLSNLSSRLQL